MNPGAGGGNQPETPANDPAQEEIARKEEEARKQKELLEIRRGHRERLEKLRNRLADDPDSLLTVADQIEITLRDSRMEAGVKAEYRSFYEQLESQKKVRAHQLLEDARKRSTALLQEGKYLLAHDVFRERPAVVLEVQEINQEWVLAEQQAENYAKKGKYWAMIVEKVHEWIKREEPEVALAILDENIKASEYRGEFEIIWKEREELYAEIQQSAGQKIASIIELERKQVEEALALLRRQREEERRERWKFALEAVPWWPVISVSRDLENWLHGPMINQDKIGQPGVKHEVWEIEIVDGLPVLKADTADLQQEATIAQNGNRWQDWALEFEIRVTRGKARLEARARMGAGGWVLGKAERDIEFEAGKHSDWTRVRLYVHGEQVRRFEFQDGEPVEVESIPHVEEQQTGGFRFVLDPDSACQIRDARVKLVSEIRRGDPLSDSKYSIDDVSEDDVIEGGLDPR